MRMRRELFGGSLLVRIGLELGRDFGNRDASSALAQGDDPVESFAEWIDRIGRRLEGFGAQTILLTSVSEPVPYELREELVRFGRMLHSSRVRLVMLERGSRPIFADDIALAELDSDGGIATRSAERNRARDRRAEQLRWLIEIAVMMSWNDEHTSALAAIARAAEHAESPLDIGCVSLHEGNILARAGQVASAMARYHRGLQHLTDAGIEFPPLLVAGLIAGVGGCGVEFSEIGGDALYEIAANLCHTVGNAIGAVRYECAYAAALFRSGRGDEAERRWRRALGLAMGLQERARCAD